MNKKRRKDSSRKNRRRDNLPSDCRNQTPFYRKASGQVR